MTPKEKLRNAILEAIGIFQDRDLLPAHEILEIVEGVAKNLHEDAASVDRARPAETSE